MKILSTLILLIFNSNFSNAAEFLDCKYKNNKKFKIEASEVLITKSWDSYYSMSSLAIHLSTPENIYAPRNKEFSCESKANSSLFCVFKNGKSLNIEVENLSFENKYSYDYDDLGIVSKKLTKRLYVNDDSIEDLLYKYKNVECVLEL